MADGKPLSISDLFLLAVGLYRPKELPDANLPAEKYWLKDGALRETEWNPNWILSPKRAWQSVRHRAWLLANIADNLAGHKQEFKAIPDDMLMSLDLLPKEFKPGMPGMTPAIQNLVSVKNYDRSFLTTLSLGLSKYKTKGGDLILFGAGLRRRTRVWVRGDEGQALQADVEIFVPFYAAPPEGQKTIDDFPGARAISAGIALTRANGSSIGVDKDKKDLAGVRFNFRMPFQAGAGEPESATPADGAVVKVQKRAFKENSAWQDFKEWEEFVGRFCPSDEGGELLNAPIGPLLLETVSDPSGITDILLNKDKKRAEIKEQLEESKEALKEALALLKKLSEVKGLDKAAPPDTSSSFRRLGGLLASAGLLEDKGAGTGNYKYKLRDLHGLTVAQIVNSVVLELEGFPLWVKGLDPKEPDAIRGAVTLAAKVDEVDANKQYFGIAGLFYNIAVEESSDDSKGDPEAVKIKPQPKPEGADDKDKSHPPQMKIHLGKWFSDETVDDNWVRRLLPSLQGEEKSPWKRRVALPGIRLLPLKRVYDPTTMQASFSPTLRGELVSIGFDIKGGGKEGLALTKFKRGPLAYFGLGAVEVRLAVLMSADRVAFGAGLKLKDLRLSFGPKEADEEEDDVLGALKHLFAEEEEEEKEDKPLKTRLGGQKTDKFSVSVGYLSPLTTGSAGTLDIQLYDEEGNRGKMVWIPIDRQPGPLYVKQIGVGLEGVENVEIGEGKGLSDDAQVTVAVTGGLRFPAFELGLIGANLIIPLKRPLELDWGLDGLDVSAKAGDVVISGSLLKVGLDYAGMITIDLPKLSIGAMGYYGNTPIFNKSFPEDVYNEFGKGKVHPTLQKALADKGITPVPDNIGPVRRGPSSGVWELRTAKGETYMLVKHEGKLHVLSYDKSLFIYGVVSLAEGCGLKAGPIEFTGFAIGLGINRKIVIPPIEKVADFPLVKIVMGKGGLQKEPEGEGLRNLLGEPIKDPAEMLEKMKDHLPAERGQHFFCIGARFTISKTVDCFALITVQWGKEFELSLLGLARFRLPRDPEAKALCYVEMQVMMTLKPSEGVFKLQAMLTSNSWVINKDCKLTGGFAFYAWFGGEHKGDFVLTLGGYHPRFRRPAHYPLVPRVGLNWPISDTLSVKGALYIAFTPSCMMLGSLFEASFQSGRVSAWFTVHLDAIMYWSPLHFEVEVGVSMRIEATFFLTTLKLAISASIEMWGPPVGGIARVNLTLISFDIPFDVRFGTQREEAKPKLIESWAQFCRSFLGGDGSADRQVIDAPLPALPVLQPSLASGLNNMSRAKNDGAGEDPTWRVRGDELELAASASVPVTTLKFGKVKAGGLPPGVRGSDFEGKPLLVAGGLELEREGMWEENYAAPLGVHPMGKGLKSVLNVTVVLDDVSATEPVNLSDWTIKEETDALPAALWDPAAPDPKGPSEPDAKLIPGCITGVKRLKPPTGKRGRQARLPEVSWHALTPRSVPGSAAPQGVPAPDGPRDINVAVAAKRAEQEQVFDALSDAGFDLTRRPAAAAADFRVLQARPLFYADRTPA